MKRRAALLCGVLLGAAAPASAVPTLTARAAGPTITVSPGAGAPATSVTVTGAGFPAGQVVALYIDLPGPFLGQPGPTADAQGGFHQTFAWPGSNFDATGRVKPAAVGVHQVCGSTSYPGSQQTSNVQACTAFVVQAGQSPSPSPSASPASGQLSGPSPMAVAVVIGILILLAVVTGFLMRQTKN